ncbi:hypothetical protein [Streptomyces sp. NPDC091416]|uniref:hypothetical protein n=1 Tax=Streptomyces sp. NPDC091416 TaxID=3366003 RepID=UPI0037F99A95
MLYDLYLAAGSPTLDAMAGLFADLDPEDRTIRASPSRDTIRRLIRDPDVPPKQADVVALVMLLARSTGGESEEAGQEAARLWRIARQYVPPGRPVAELDPHDLEVHRAIDLGDEDGLPPLPAYVERSHDGSLRRLVAEADAGSSRLVMLIGTSSTGKTRACWEAVQTLRDGWRLWHPISPDRPEAALRELEQVGPRTVVWLNDAQHYLLDERHGEPIAAGLRNALADPSRAPVLVLGTLWPGYHDRIRAGTAHPSPSASSQIRELLKKGHVLSVPTRFDDHEVAALLKAQDPRLAVAARRAADGMITQYLAGAPELLTLFESAEPSVRALLCAAMDARRLGHPVRLPLPFLAAAAEGYLSDVDWDLLDENWLEEALARVTAPVKGARGPLHPQRRPRGGRPPVPTAQSYRLADYLEQIGTTTRRSAPVPELFWEACLEHTSPGAAGVLAAAAHNRGLMRIACALWLRAGADHLIADWLVSADRAAEALP